jgi:hypothetical protein
MCRPGTPSSTTQQQGLRITALTSVAGLHLLLRSITLSDFTAGAPGSRAWAATLVVQSAWLWADLQEKEGTEADRAACLELMQGMLPVMQHVAAAMCRQDTHQAEQMQAPTGSCTSGRGLGTSRVATAQTYPTQQESAAATSPFRPPADSCLLLLMAAAHTVNAAVKLGCSGSQQPKAQQGGNSSSSDAQSGLQDTEQLLGGLESLLSLAHSLTLQEPGSWWEEARRYFPLLLIQALTTTLKVCTSLATITILVLFGPGLFAYI